MTKDLALSIFKKGHADFQAVIKHLTPDKIETIKVRDIWTIKDIISHLSGWLWEFIVEIESFLANHPKINVSSDDDTFNEKSVAIRKSKSVQEVVGEWEQAYQAVVAKIESLSTDDWDHVCPGQFWPDGREVSIQNLFASYQDTQLSHDHEHAIQVKKVLESR